MNQIQAAWQLAERLHHDQRYYPGNRPEPVPYLYHLGAVFIEAVAAAGDLAEPARTELLLTAILHDTLEDTPVTETYLAEQFGPAVLLNVRALSKREDLPKADRMPDSLERILTCGPVCAMVKLCDRIANISQPAPAEWDAARRLAYLAESRMILERLGAASPGLAARLGEKILAYSVGL